ncbi:uncharacterized protein MYCFIDRAFT_134467 [Pseudocercospora fijiensis CIRAD86]|uniref:FAM86 N-terminal domain-containing protein n=1 Tax=Pseudocercospora fijiensis (strain CIRAD86) TaxID=383855 RepID=M3AHM5_PSEFD|nr:uncharacterized protein MYCFIDRAFT_134467 [Pseudocercospora fijiensis CIRAD86]EME84086.1 hypothetical protein MYCFIDRAFT_134467 [Pseudocercospora fijiensis CIRAD86]
MDPQLLLFRRQYFQLHEPDFLAWPPKQLLKDPSVQAWLYAKLFDGEKNAYLPAERYQFRVLKPLVSKIEQAIEDPEEDEISDDLMSRLSTLIASDLPGELIAAQQKSYVTFTCLPPEVSTIDEDYRSEPTITLLERRNLISGSLTTGFRTWEAALHLGSYLLSPKGQNYIRGKSVLELGAGTGFMAILAAKHLEGNHVTITDGDESVVEALKENLFLNGLDDDKKVITSVLRWGHGLKGTWVEEDCEEWPYDVVIGADITYEKTAITALVGTLRMLFDLRPALQVLISGAVRNVETFETFRHACLRSNFDVKEVDFEPKPIHQQTSLFYAKAVPLKILSITKPGP